jgi:hypothetical protein
MYFAIVVFQFVLLQTYEFFGGNLSFHIDDNIQSCAKSQPAQARTVTGWLMHLLPQKSGAA